VKKAYEYFSPSKGKFLYSNELNWKNTQLSNFFNANNATNINQTMSPMAPNRTLSTGVQLRRMVSTGHTLGALSSGGLSPNRVNRPQAQL
jgi:hypothetical protein